RCRKPAGWLREELSQPDCCLKLYRRFELLHRACEAVEYFPRCTGFLTLHVGKGDVMKEANRNKPAGERRIESLAGLPWTPRDALQKFNLALVLTIPQLIPADSRGELLREVELRGMFPSQGDEVAVKRQVITDNDSQTNSNL